MMQLFGPIAEFLGPQDDELIIVPDGVLCFIPWAAVTGSIRIHTVPSLTSCQLILSAAEGYRKKTGVLLVGNPCLKELKEPLDDLPCAQEEVEMIASILNIIPLIGTHVTKAEIMKRMSSVGLIHIAAHENKLTGVIALSPNPRWTSKFPQEEDFILKISDLQAAHLRARLVVLSCYHSGRSILLKGEGLVGIARAFLAFLQIPFQGRHLSFQCDCSLSKNEDCSHDNVLRERFCSHSFSFFCHILKSRLFFSILAVLGTIFVP